VDIGIVAVVLQLIFLEGILSIDNAAVLGALASRLPNNRMIPWPRFLRFMRRPGRVVLGKQRGAALRVGLLGAYVGRGAMLFFAGLVISHPWIRIAGAAYLLFLTVRYFAEMCNNHSRMKNEPGTPAGKAALPGFWRTVLSIELADLAFSVDNVVAAVALSPEFWITLLGVGIGIIVMRFAASIFARLILWEPALATAAYVLIGAVGLELILESAAGVFLTEIEQFAVSASIVAVTLLVARTRLRSLSRRLGFFPRFCMAVCGFFHGLERSLRGGGAGSDGGPSTRPGRTGPPGSS
jgi:tellurite resistance protein TerC